MHKAQQTKRREVGFEIVAQAINEETGDCLSIARGADGTWCAQTVDAQGRAMTSFFDRAPIVEMTNALNRELAS